MFDFQYAYDFLKYKRIQFEKCQVRFVFYDFKKTILLSKNSKFYFLDKSYKQILRKLKSRDRRILAQLGYRSEFDIQKAESELMQMGEEKYNNMNKPYQSPVFSLLNQQPSSNFFQFYSKI